MALSHVGRVGRLNVRFCAHRGRTAIRDVYYEVPAKVTRLQFSPASDIAHLILMHTTAGLFGGDSVDSAIHVESGARVLITQQSATKVHPSRGLIARQRTTVRVESEGELHLFLKPVIPFAASKLEQSMQIDLDAGSRLWFWEGLMAGRVAHGEVWQFTQLASETLVRLDSRPLYLDRFRLCSAGDSPERPWVMESCRYLGTGLRFAPDSPVALAEQLHEQLPEAGVDSPVQDLTCVRTLTETGPEYYRQAAAFRAVCTAVERSSRSGTCQE